MTRHRTAMPIVLCVSAAVVPVLRLGAARLVRWSAGPPAAKAAGSRP